MEAPGASVPFSLKPILIELERGRYIGPILPASLANLVAGRRPVGGGAPKSGSGGVSVSGRGGGDSGNLKTSPKVASTRVSARVKVRYDHLPDLLVLSVWVELAVHSGRGGPPHSAQPFSLQELEFVWGVLGGLRA